MSKKRELTSQEFDKEYEKFIILIDDVKSQIASINENILLLNQERNFYFKRKVELSIQLEELVKEKNG